MRRAAPANGSSALGSRATARGRRSQMRGAVRHRGLPIVGRARRGRRAGGTMTRTMPRPTLACIAARNAGAHRRAQTLRACAASVATAPLRRTTAWRRASQRAQRAPDVGSVSRRTSPSAARASRCAATPPRCPPSRASSSASRRPRADARRSARIHQLERHQRQRRAARSRASNRVERRRRPARAIARVTSCTGQRAQPQREPR